MYCLPDDANISLEGYEGSESQISLYLRINTCKGPQCITGADFDTYMNNHLDQYDYFKVRLLFVDTIISPSDPTVTQKTLEKDVFLTFSQTMGSRGQIVLGRYEVTTD